MNVGTISTATNSPDKSTPAAWHSPARRAAATVGAGALAMGLAVGLSTPPYGVSQLRHFGKAALGGAAFGALVAPAVAAGAAPGSEGQRMLRTFGAAAALGAIGNTALWAGGRASAGYGLGSAIGLGAIAGAFFLGPAAVIANATMDAGSDRSSGLPTAR